MLEEFFLMLKRLQQADFLMLVMEPLFYMGVFLGLVGFVVGHFLGDNRARSTGLVIIAASCFALYPYLKLAAKAAPRIAAMSSNNYSSGAIKAQVQRRHEARWVFYGMGCFAVMGLASGGNSAKLIGMATIAGAFGVSLFGLWLHMKECEIYQPYIKQTVRAAPPPPHARR